MQATRINNRLPQVFRIARTSPTTYNTTRKMSLFPRYIEQEFAPARDLFRLFDDYASHVQSRGGNGLGSAGFSKQLRSFTPKFDVKENKDSYELHGELPGIEQKNINIEFTDAQTLTIKGRTEHYREEGTRPSGLIEGGKQQGQIEGGDSNGNYHKPSVEDESQMSGANPDAQKQETQVQKSEKKEDGSRYWVSERSVGEFARTFSFPSRVDQENVKASLKDGILSIVVPKTQAPTSKRINIE